MPMRRRLAILVTAAAALAACGDAPATAPAPPDESALASAPGTPIAGATTADTSRATNLPSSVRLEGRVMLPAAGDSTQLVAAPGARLTLYRNQLVDGRATTTKVAETTAAADASYAFDGVPGGYYVLSVDVTPARFWGSHVAFILADAPVVRVTVPFWRRS